MSNNKKGFGVYRSHKSEMDYIDAISLSELVYKVNKYNDENSDNPILKEDIVQIMKEGETFIMLYYK